jgi:hypothetical protein
MSPQVGGPGAWNAAALAINTARAGHADVSSPGSGSSEQSSSRSVGAATDICVALQLSKRPTARSVGWSGGLLGPPMKRRTHQPSCRHRSAPEQQRSWSPAAAPSMPAAHTSNTPAPPTWARSDHGLLRGLQRRLPSALTGNMTYARFGHGACAAARRARSRGRWAALASIRRRAAAPTSIVTLAHVQRSGTRTPGSGCPAGQLQHAPRLPRRPPTSPRRTACT